MPHALDTAVALVGMPGSGKSTVGRHLARQLGLRFVDSDTEIERRIGMPIKDYFAQHGEESFRDREQEVIDELTVQPDILLATGGGAVLRPSNRDALHSRTHVFYLRSTPEELHRRLRHDTHRPLPVSYTHLDVYKRQAVSRAARALLRSACRLPW